jgi:aspartyl-tRNA(Asn)/glutamyl-tRNA(Gln) amidotransferase subunit A
MSGELWRLSATEAEKRFRAGDLRPSDVLASVLRRLDDVNDRINAFAAIDREGALDQANASDARWKVGRPLGPLDGSMVTVKDNITVKGLPCAWGSELFRDYIPDNDETPVRRLRDAGCILLGKTTVSEFTTAQTNVSTRAFGTTRNPWDLRLTTGASSGGACAALASGIGQIGLATDGGGSIRRPASHCGLLGLKPTVGRVARRHGLPAILHDCEVIGPIARNASDIALAFNAIAGPDPEDRASLAFGNGPPRSARSALRRVFYAPRVEGHSVDAEIEDACAKAVQQLSGMGFDIETGPAPFDFPLYEKHWPAIRDAGLAWVVRGRDWKGRISELHSSLVARGQTVMAADYVDALAAFHELQAAFGRFFEQHDLFMTPTAGSLPWPAEESGPARNRVFTGIVNAAGNPAISIPIAHAAGALPVGFQLVGPFGSDTELIEIAAQYQEHHSWTEIWPPL